MSRDHVPPSNNHNTKPWPPFTSTTSNNKQRHSRELLLYPGDLLLKHVRGEGVAQPLGDGVAVLGQEAVRLVDHVASFRELLQVQLQEAQSASKLTFRSTFHCLPFRLAFRKR